MTQSGIVLATFQFVTQLRIRDVRPLKACVPNHHTTRCHITADHNM
jgi:hypothetical protein